MKERFDRLGSSMDCFDPCTGHDLTITRSVEINDECPRMMSLFESVIVDYAQSTTGMMVRICYRAEGADETVTVVPFDLDRLAEGVVEEIACFADTCGLTYIELTLILMRETPHIDREKLIADFRTYSLAPDNQFEFFLKKAHLTPAQLLA